MLPKSYVKYGGMPCGVCGLGVDTYYPGAVHGYPPRKTRKEWMHGECAPPTCSLCDRPALPGSDYCPTHYNAICAPDPLCACCGEPLGEADIAAGEVTCVGCGDGEEVKQC